MIFAGSMGRPRGFRPRRSYPRRGYYPYYPEYSVPEIYIAPQSPTCVRLPAPMALPPCAGTWVKRDAETICCLPSGFAGAALRKKARPKKPDNSARDQLWALMKRGFYKAVAPR